MMEDLKERLIGVGSQLKDRIQESSIYNKIRDRYENLSPLQQKGVLILTCLFALFLLMYWPLATLSNSHDSILDFQAKRDLIRELLKVSKEASEVPALPQPPPMDQIQSQLEGFIRDANLLPNQNRGVSRISNSSKLIPESRSQGTLKVELSQLNLRQIINLTTQMQGFGPSVKMNSLMIVANNELPEYFDLAVTLTALKIPIISKPVLVEPEARAKKKNKTPGELNPGGAGE